MTHSGIAHSAAADRYDADVAILGGGPVGTLLAILLGRRGKKVALIERWKECYGRPRAVTYDHEIARILATLGIDSENDPAISYHDELYYWKNADGENIQIVDWQSTSASGWRVRYWFNQPDLENRLLNMARKIPSITDIRGWEAFELDEDGQGVTIGLRETAAAAVGPDSGRRSVRARYVVGADGANSFVREAIGIESVDKGYFFNWLILDLIPHEEYAARPAQWQLCDPKRPTTIVPGGPGRRRWEFMVLPGEDPKELAKPENAWKLLEPWGMTPGNATLERDAVYCFQARWAKEWRKGRCMIAGDAAHLMPPFAGEGMCAGLRDAFALGWRLDAILEGKCGDDVLDSYTTERKEHAKHYIEFSQELGKIICITDPEAAAERDRGMKADLAARNNKPVPTDVCQLGPGVWCGDTAHAGELSVQGVVEAKGQRGRFDQVVGRGWIVMGLDRSPAQALRPDQVEAVEMLDGLTVKVGAPGTDCDAEDVEGTYAKWLKGIGTTFVVLRPDFYVAATADTPEDLRRRFDEVLSRLHLMGEAEAAGFAMAGAA